MCKFEKSCKLEKFFSASLSEWWKHTDKLEAGDVRRVQRINSEKVNTENIIENASEN